MTGDEGRPPVVVGVDGTPAARLALVWAIDEADRRGLPLCLVHAWNGQAETAAEPFALETRPSALETRQTSDEVRRSAGRRILDEAEALAAARHPRVPLDRVLVNGSPTAALSRSRPNAALIVVGSRHLSSAREVMTTRTIAVPIVAHARCPVVVVREPEHTSATPATVVVGVDGSRASVPAVAFAYEEASLRGATLSAVHVRRFDRLPAVASDVRAQQTKEGRIRLAETLAGWQERFPDVPTKHEVLFGHPVPALTEASAHALCLVVGSRGLGGFRGMLLGSASHGVLHHARCPVIVTPDHEDATERD
ncbi:universal stress protein [Embleya scabrispora]|uniref:universal stress protein n=1 Tax=Embleya scabrispora TaxID=159449 RepID=UPI000378DEE8|nr:universal stress protein [Embleya scabrispora]MYS86560.1 universal stress protein [Streptomyces sp. SID5474]